MTILSHVLDFNGSCSRCGVELSSLELAPGSKAPSPGDRLGVISGLNYSKTSAYRISVESFDSNKMCEPK